MGHADVQAFFSRYRDAFNALDGHAVADLWHASSGMADSVGGHGRLTWWPEDAPMRANHHALCEVYRQADYGRADFRIDHLVPLGAHHAFVRLQWTITRVDGSLLQQFHTGYQLMRTASGPRVLLCTAFEEDLQEMTRHVAQ